MLEIIGHADQYAKLSRAIMPLLKFWQIYQSLQDSLETKTLDAARRRQRATRPRKPTPPRATRTPPTACRTWASW